MNPTRPSTDAGRQHLSLRAWLWCAVLAGLALLLLVLHLAPREAARAELLGALLGLLLLAALLVLARAQRQQPERPRAQATASPQQPQQPQTETEPQTETLAGVPTDAPPLPPHPAVLQRLQRALAHASKHPGYGFAVLSLEVEAADAAAAGDTWPAQVAQRLQSTLRPGDLIVAQPLEEAVRAAAGAGADAGVDAGADADTVADANARRSRTGWFAVLDGVGQMQRATAVAERVMKEMAEPYLVGCSPQRGSTSLGVVLHGGTARSGQPAPDAAQLLRDATTARVEARRAGAGRWRLFDDSMQERLQRTRVLATELRQALDRDELLLLYQPVLALADGTVAAVEVLLRWRHPQRGLLRPAEFIDVAEEAGLDDALAQAVLQQACTQYMRWRVEHGAQAPPLLAIKLSRAQLQRGPALVAALAAALQRCGMRPEWLQLQVTEGVAAQGEPVPATLRELKAMGLRLALDDFGRGHSSLARLHQLPVDTVRIDRGFVGHAQTVEHHRVLIEATIRVAHTLGMATVAQGVDSAGQAALMQALSCDRAQGSLYAAPMDAVALSAWLAAQRTPPA